MFENSHYCIRKELRDFGKKFGGALLCLICLSLFMRITVSAAYQNTLQQGIADEVLRFHVLAESDSEEDQNVKYKVRDAVLAWLSEEMKKADVDNSEAGVDSKNAVKCFVQAHLAELEHVADQVLSEYGADYRAAASVERCCFPARTYGDCTFPAGWYDALRIRLGSAQGHNWWCVLYPKLCFSDCLHAVVGENEKQELRSVLTEEEYDSLLQNPGSWRIAFRWF